jgi:hypothetical protein
MGLLLVAFGGGALLLLAAGRYHQDQILRDWEMVLTPRAQRKLDTWSARARGERELSRFSFQEAQAAWKRGDRDDALRCLDVGLMLVETSSPDWITFLRGMAVLSRMATAIAPVPPLRPRRFRLRRLEGLAALGALAHHLLVTTAERFRLRAYLLQHGFGIAGRFMRAARARLQRPRPRAAEEWTGIRRARLDFSTLSDESVETFRVLLLSLSAEAR